MGCFWSSPTVDELIQTAQPTPLQHTNTHTQELHQQQHLPLALQRHTLLQAGHVPSDAVRVRPPIRALASEQHLVVRSLAPAQTTVATAAESPLSAQQLQQQQMAIQQMYEPAAVPRPTALGRFMTYLMSAAPSAVVKSKEQREEEKFMNNEQRLTQRIETMENKVTQEFDELRMMEQQRYDRLKANIEIKERELQALVKTVATNRPDRRPTDADVLQATNLITSKINLVSNLRTSSDALLGIDKAHGDATQYIHNRKKALRTARITMAAKRVSGDDDHVEDELAQAEDVTADMAGLNAICATFSIQTATQNAAVETKDTQISDMVRQLFAQQPVQSTMPVNTQPQAGQGSASLIRPTAAAISSTLLQPASAPAPATAPRRMIAYGQALEQPEQQPSDAPVPALL